MKKEQVIEYIRKERLIAIIREDNQEIARTIIDRIIDSGIKIIEITMNSNNPIELIKYIKCKYPKIVIGVGTVLDKKTLKNVLNEGVEFIVSPISDNKLIKICNRKKILYIPGVVTPNEIFIGWKRNIKIFKLFPCSNFNPNIINTYKSILKDIEIIPTGGINRVNAKEWINCGAFAIGVGNFISKEAKRTGDYNKINEIIKDLIKEI